MGTDDRRVATDRQTVYEDLAGRLQTLRDGTHGGRLAQDLLRYAGDGRELVALVDDGERAVVYHASSRILHSVPVQRDGVHGEAAERVGSRLSDPATWVDAVADDDLAWVHPRYRWVLTSERDSWWYRGR